MDPIPNMFHRSDSDPDSDSDSVNCFVTDLFESRSSEHCRFCSCDDMNINPFSDVDCDLHHGEIGLGLGLRFAVDDSVGESSGGLRVVGFGFDSDSSSEEGELDGAMEFGSGVNGFGGGDDGDRVGVDGGFDEFDVRLCWDSLCLEDERTLNESFEWEEVEVLGSHPPQQEERVNEVEVEADGDSVGSGFTNGEEALRDLEWEILLAVNHLERNSGLEHDDVSGGGGDSYLALPDGYFYAAEYDVLFGQLLENDGGMKGSPPAAKSVMENLPVVEELQGMDVTCAICKEGMLLEEKVRKLPCSHCYHGDCIFPWLKIRNTCPVCRFELPTDDPEYEQRKCQRSTTQAGLDLLELAAQMQF